MSRQTKKAHMHIVALQNTVGTLTSEKLALTEALQELGYCHEQQTAFITNSMSGPDGAISQTLLLQETKASLAEAIETNKSLTDDIEFQQYRYKNLLGSHGQLGRTCRDLEQVKHSLTDNLLYTRVWAIAATAVLAIGACYHIGVIL